MSAKDRGPPEKEAALSACADVPGGTVRDLDTPLPQGSGELLHLKFLARARAAPQSTAIEHAGRAYAYGEVEARSRALALKLQDAGVRPGDTVGVLASRGPQVVWSILAVARLGGVFVVLDATYPPARLRRLIDICAPAAVIAAGVDLEGFTDLVSGAQNRLLPGDEPDAAPPAVPGEPALAGCPEPRSADDVAYLLFTSGSTGAPKCVAASHRPLTHFLAWHVATFGLTAADRFTMLSGLSHDPVLRDIFTPLSIGATLVIPSQTTINEPGALTRWARDVGATVCHLTPPMGQLLAAGAARTPSLPALRKLFWGGDRLALTRIADIARIAPQAEHVNFYGATETPQVVACFRHDGDASRPILPIGRGCAGAQVFLVDDERRPVGPGEEGEVAVRSNSLSLGYVENGRVRPAEDRGVDGQGLANIYYTGDRGRYLAGGDITVLGRTDDQVKVRGYRVDLSEITAELMRRSGVVEAMTLAAGAGADLRIVSFCAGARLAPADLAAHLASRLPAYMAPQRIEVLDALPRLPNMKIDRQALRRRAEAEQSPPPIEAGPAAPRADLTEAERALVSEWAKLFAGAPIARESTLASLGGDSLSYVSAYLATEKVLGAVPAGWQNMTIAELAARRRAPSRFWTSVDAPLLIRAIAIVLVVALHYRLLDYDDGATTALFLVSGFLFGGLQFPQAWRRRSPKPIFKSLLNVAIPTALFSAFAYSEKLIRGKHTSANIILLANDLIDHAKLIASGVKIEDYQLHLWYVDALIKIVLVVGLLFALTPKRLLDKIGMFGFVIAIFAIGCVARFVVPGLFDGNFFAHGVKKLSLFYVAPTSHLATFILGMLAASAATRPQRGLAALLIGSYALLTAKFFGVANAISIALAGFVLLGTGRIPAPRPLAALVFPLAGASLFIYLTHYMFGSMVETVTGGPHPLLQAIAGLAGGFAVWRAWTWATGAVKRRLSRPSAAHPGGRRDERALITAPSKSDAL
jgi:amino acid adenylation domain-containing protein